MSRRPWHCFACDAELGRVTTDREGREHLRVWSERIIAVYPMPTTPQTWTILCWCSAKRCFTGEQVHLEDRRMVA